MGAPPGPRGLSLSALSPSATFFFFLFCLPLVLHPAHGEKAGLPGGCSSQEASFLQRLEQKGYSWEVVACDAGGRVVGLDLYLGPLVSQDIDLSGLPHLERLNLTVRSDIQDLPVFGISFPLALDGLANLTHLNLSGSGLTGEVPAGIARLTKLEVLDLSAPVMDQGLPHLIPQIPDLGLLVRDMSRLRELRLDGSNISWGGVGWVETLTSSVPQLRVLSLGRCDLSGSVGASQLSRFRFLSELRLQGNNLSSVEPEAFLLPYLKVVDVSNNPTLKGHLPEFPTGSLLEVLRLSGTALSGKIPDSVRNIRSLRELQLGGCRLSGRIPPSLPDLARLVIVDLSNNSFTGPIPPRLLSSPENIAEVLLSHNKLTGPIPAPSRRSLSNLARLELQGNSLNGSIPPLLFQLPSLRTLLLGENRLSGQLEELQGSAPALGLQRLSLGGNMLDGMVPLSFFELPELSVLDLSSNSLTLPAAGPNASHESLVDLDLSNNGIAGRVPIWLSNFARGNNLSYLNLSHNMFDGFEQSPVSFATNLRILDLHSNRLPAPIPLPPRGVDFVDYSDNAFASAIPEEIVKQLLFFGQMLSLSGNSLTGEIPPSLCDLCSTSVLQVLDLSNNRLTGEIPPCFARCVNLAVLNLRRNMLHGPMPQSFTEGCRLHTLDLSENQLHGPVPASLANCTNLELLNLGRNRFNEAFPWPVVESLPKLRVLVLQSNKFHGTVECRRNDSRSLPALRVVNLSSNRFSGGLPASCFRRWAAAMKEKTGSSGTDEVIQYCVEFGGYRPTTYLVNSMEITDKGRHFYMVKILTYYTSIMLAHNQFQGTIPEEVGDLVLLHTLNISHNGLTGGIPPSMGRLTALESLDLSWNRLSGEIPPQLQSLTFLGTLDLAENRLVGRVPQGGQMLTFNYTSFEGNPGLCGLPLSRPCSGSEPPPVGAPPPPRRKLVDWGSHWVGFGLGVGLGTVFGPVMLWRKGFFDHRPPPPRNRRVMRRPGHETRHGGR